jgi:hypothetical protein
METFKFQMHIKRKGIQTNSHVAEELKQLVLEVSGLSGIQFL